MQIVKKVQVSQLAVGSLIRPPEREMRLWMRREAETRGCGDSGLWMIVTEIGEAAPDKKGRWMRVVGQMVASFGSTHPFTFKARPESLWPAVVAVSAGEGR